jgi:hypothetical protein
VNASKRPFLPVLLGLGLGTSLLIAVASLAAQSGSIADDLLRQKMGFSASDLLTLDAGSAVIKNLDTPVGEELAYVGVVYIDTPAEHFIDRFRDIERFERGPGIPQIGRFGSPPRLEDLASLTLPATDVKALPQCLLGDCDVKLSAAAMHRFRNEVDWSSPNAAHQANKVAREMILDLVHRYQADGNTALEYYNDGDDPLHFAEEFRALLASPDPLPVPIPKFLAYLDNYPRGRPTGAEDFFYGGVVDFGLKPTIRANHVTIYPLAVGLSSGVAYVIATKQLYASHYFYTTLELRFLVNDDRRSRRRGTYLISITRSRNDGMTGFKGFFLRPIIRHRSRDAVLGYLEHAKRQVEGRARAAP